MLRGKRVVITGAGRGIGEAIAKAYAIEGAKLILCARSKDQIQRVAVECEQLGADGFSETVDLDLACPEGVDQLVQVVMEKGGCDVLVNNAGCWVPGNATEGNVVEMDRLMYLNATAPMRLTRQLTPKMVEKGGGVVLNIGCSAAIDNQISGLNAAYSASKHALRGWSLSIYDSLRESNVKVMLINPDCVGTAMLANSPNAICENMIQPKDVAEVALLPLRVSGTCIPTEVTLRLAKSAFKS